MSVHSHSLACVPGCRLTEPTPTQTPATWPFAIDEDNLTNAIFYSSTLETTGGGSKAAARQQARLMLAAPYLLQTLEAVALSLDQGNTVLARWQASEGGALFKGGTR